MTFPRREFLKVLGSGSVLSLAGVAPAFLNRLSAEEAARKLSGPQPAERVLVLIQLAGGNDSLNTVIPYADDLYYKARPGIAVSKSSVLKLNEHLGLHPSLTGFQKLHEAGRLAVVNDVGYPQPDRSHFRSMDIWHSAKPEMEYTRDGWLGRALDWRAGHQVSAIDAMALGMDQLPLGLLSTTINVPTIRRLEEFHLHDASSMEAVRQKQLAALKTSRDASADTDLNFVHQTMKSAIASAERLKSLGATYNPKTVYPGTGLGQQLKLVAQMLVAELPFKIFFLSLNGFDTHATQLAVHANLLKELGDAVAAFLGDLDDHKLADRVAVATFSEFGRRVKENGSLGTDHGAAAAQFLSVPFGIRGIIGGPPNLSDLDDGDVKFRIDFRSIYAAILERWLGIPSEPVLGGKFTPLADWAAV